MKLAGVVILYNPDISNINNMLTYLAQLDKLYVVDNSPETLAQLQTFLSENKSVCYLHDKENKGISTRLNQVVELALKDQFEWLLTMDQDSSFQKEMYECYMGCFIQFPGKELVSMFGIEFLGKNGLSTNCNFRKVNHLITSGSLLNLEVCRKVGGFDENLFIDEVDFEYCLRSVLKGFNIIQFSNIHFNHNLGEMSIHRSLKNAKITKRVLHSPHRLYYMTRNFFYVNSRYKNEFPEEMKERRKNLINRIKNNLLYSNRRLQVAKYILKGLADYKGKMGKIK